MKAAGRRSGGKGCSGDEEPERGEGRGAQPDREQQPDDGARRVRLRGLPAERQGDDDEHDELQGDDVEQRHHLAQQQAVAGEG